MDVDMSDFFQNTQLGYAIWFKYQPFIDITTIELKVDSTTKQTFSGQTSTLVIDTIQYALIHLEQYKDKGTNILHHYVMFDEKNNIIRHVVNIQGQNQVHNLEFDFDTLEYEGKWVLFSILYDNINSKIRILFYLSGSITPQITEINEKPQYSSTIRFILGGAVSYTNSGITYSLNQFKGRISDLIQTQQNNILTDFPSFLSQCSLYDTCVNEQIALSDPLQENIGLQFTSYVSQPIETNKYIIYGWFKLDSLSEQTSKTSVAIRITINQKYTNNDFIGDRLLYFQYQQNQVSGSNGFEVSTYSYTFPLSQQYKTLTDDIVSYYSSSMQIALTNWHYMQYEMGRSDQIGPKLTLIFPQLPITTFIYTWSKQIYHFTGSKMYIQIGGDKYSSSSYYSGSIANLKFQNCLSNDSPILLKCHYSCVLCIGPTINNCQTCPNSRIYSISQQTCTCKSGFIDMEDTLECIALNVLYPSITEIEEEISLIECVHGYFYFGDQCIQCPQQSILNDKILIYCVDCIVNPFTWQYSLLCTYDYISYSYDQANNYIKYKRDQINYDFYQIVDSFPQLLNGFLDQNSCKKGYFNLNSLCYKCNIGCQQCTSDKFCSECELGFALVESTFCKPCVNCPTCYYESGSLLCTSCSEKQVLVNGICQDCGYKCQSCTSTQCLYCEDSSLYYLSFDGQNCQPCVLDNCLYCYQYAFYGSALLFTLEYDILYIPLTYFQLQTACAYCINNKYIDMSTGLCVDKVIRIDPVINEVDPIPPPSTCNLGLYTTSSVEKCLMSQIDFSAVEQTKCDIQNCAYCIKNYAGSIQYCMICNQGYYANNLSGQCLICPIACYTCQMQNKYTKDGWKWKIRAYYKFVFDNDGSHSYLQYGQSDQESDYEILCTSCQVGKLLYKDTCINDCDSKCQECNILEGVAVCTQCAESIDGPARTNIDGICTECQSTCSACQSRDNNDYNLYYSSSQLKFSKYCYESDSYLDQFGLVTVCDTFPKCKKSIIIKINLYCQIDDYTQELNQAINQEQFKLQNVMIEDIFGAGVTIESNGLYLYLNQKSIRKTDIIFYIIQGTAEYCTIPDLSKFSTQLRQNVYSIQYLSLSLIGQEINTFIRLAGSFNLANFTTLSFINLIIDSYHSSLQASMLKIQNHYQTDTVNLINITFTSTFNQIYGFYIIIDSIKNITMQNVVLSKFYITQQSQLFTISNSNPITLTVNGFTIIDSIIDNSSIFKFSSVSQSISNVLSFNQIKVINTIMYESTFILTTHNSKDSVGSLNINDLYISQLTLVSSTFLLIPSLQSGNFKNINFLNSTLMTQSFFINTNIIQMTDLVIDTIIIDSGTIIQNTDSYTQDPLALNSIEVSTISNITFSNIIYYKAKAILKLNQFNLNEFSVTIKQMSIINTNKYGIQRGNTLSNYISFEDAIIYIESLYCLLEDIIIQRAHGYPELTLIISTQLTINRMNVKLIEDYFSRVLHTSLDCMTNLTYTDQHEIMYIGDYQYVDITELTIIGLISFNYPIVILQSKNLMQISQSEEISIKNSLFESNILVITTNNKETAIIQIISDQDLTLNLMNIQFTKNHLNQYIQDLMKQSSATILIQTQKGVVNLNEITFTQNIVTNSTDSILYIKCDTLTLSNSQFNSNNILTTELLNKNILWGDQDSDNSDKVYFQFTVISDSGNGMLIAQIININQIVIQQSYANNGAGFSISPFGQGIISIIDSIIIGTMASLEYTALSQGGFLYIDGTKAKIQLNIVNTTISESYSRYQGGAIYISPSASYNYIYLANLIVNEVYSMQNSFISVICTKLSTLSAQIIMNNITFTNSRKGFETYIGFNSLNDLTNDEIYQIQENNPFIYTLYSNITIIGCNFMNMHNQFLFQIDQGQQVFLQQIKMKNSTIYYSPLIKIIPRTSVRSYIFIDDLEISQIRQFSEISASGGDCIFLYATMSNDFTMTCPLKFSNKFSDSQYVIFEQYNSRQSNCNQYKIYQNKSVNISLIHISDIESDHKIIIRNINLNDITCTGCYFGLMHFITITITTYLQEIIKIQQLNLQNNICGTMGCLNLFQSDLLTSDLPINGDFSINRRLLNDLNYNYLSSLIVYNILITDSQLINNTAKYGSGIMIIRMSILIIRSIINQNIAEYYGGGIYFYGSDQNFYIFDSQIQENQALLGSGIYLKDYQIQKYEQLDVSINNNNSTSLTSDLFESPRSLTISLNGGSTFLTKKTIVNTSQSLQEEIYIKPYKILGTSNYANRVMFPTGQMISSYTYFDPFTQSDIPYNLTFRVIPLNQQNTQEKVISSSSICSLNAMLMNHTTETIINSQDTYLSYNSVKFNTTSGDFNLDDLIIYFSPYQDADLILRIIFKCDIIKIPIYSETPPYLVSSYVAEYSLQIDISTFPCQLGEYYNSTLGACIQCNANENQYSVFYGALSCSFKNDLTMENIKSSMILIRKNYWRPYIASKQIEDCYHLTDNCLGGWIPGNPSCTLGHIGALCEQCDLYNTRGSGSYSVSTEYSCGSCDLVTGNSLSIALISLWTLISILMSVSSTIETIDEFILALRIKAFGINVVLSHSSSGILIKVFTNYLQIISTISTFQLSVPSELASVVNSVGNPIETMAYSLDCYLITISDILIIYFRIIWSLLLATLYITIFLGLYSLAILTKQKKYNVSFITTTLIYMYIYLQPNLIGGLISLISYRIISEEYWIQGNVGYRYDTEQHYQWIIGFVLPLLIILGAILPFILWFGIYQNRFILDRTYVRKLWGYLYNEYKSKAYFWETIKILQKEFMIIVLTYYEDHITVKAALVFLVLFFYSFMTNKHKPYLTGELNTIDQRSTIVCAVSIIFASTIYSSQLAGLIEIIWPFYMMIGIMNGYFIIQILLKICFAYFNKLHDHIDKIKLKIIQIYPKMKENKIIYKYLETNQSKQNRIKGRYEQLRKYLINQAKQILEYKRSQQFELPGRLFTNPNEIYVKNSTPSHRSFIQSPLDQISEKRYIMKRLSQQDPKVYPEPQEVIFTLQHDKLPSPVKYQQE